jgi:hypothetical protein
LVGSSPEGSAAVADDAAIVSKVLLARLGLFLANEADFEVEFGPRIFQAHFGLDSVHRDADRDRLPRQKIGHRVSTYVIVLSTQLFLRKILQRFEVSIDHFPILFNLAFASYVSTCD